MGRIDLWLVSVNENNAIAWDAVDVRSELVEISFQFRMTDIPVVVRQQLTKLRSRPEGVISASGVSSMEV